MITLKSPREIEAMEKAGAALAGMHLGIREFIKPGISSWKIEEFARKYFKAAGAKAEQIGFGGTSTLPASVLTTKFATAFPGRTLS